MKEKLIRMLEAVSLLRDSFGNSFSHKTDPTDRGKLQTRLERTIYEYLSQSLADTGFAIRLEVEGWKPLYFNGNTPDYEWYVDPLDGTANTCRWMDTGARDIGSDAACVIAVARHAEQLRLSDFFASGAVDLRPAGSKGQWWVAERGIGAWTGKAGEDPRRLQPVKNYHRHSPLLGCEFYRQASWMARLLVNQAVEWSDMASSFINFLRVPLGECDCYFNNVMPQILAKGQEAPEGQRGHELGAIMPFLSELQGYALDTRTRKPLERSLFTFDGMTPVIIGADRQTVEYYLGIIDENLESKVNLYGMLLSKREVINALHQAIGVRRWSLRQLPE